MITSFGSQAISLSSPPLTGLKNRPGEEAEVLETFIKERDHVEIERHQIRSMRLAALLCIQYADSHPDEVTLLLRCNKAVCDELEILIERHGDSDERKANNLARLIASVKGGSLFVSEESMINDRIDEIVNEDAFPQELIRWVRGLDSRIPYPYRQENMRSVLAHIEKKLSTEQQAEALKVMVCIIEDLDMHELLLNAVGRLSMDQMKAVSDDFHQERRLGLIRLNARETLSGRAKVADGVVDLEVSVDGKTPSFIHYLETVEEDCRPFSMERSRLMDDLARLLLRVPLPDRDAAINKFILVVEKAGAEEHIHISKWLANATSRLPSPDILTTFDKLLSVIEKVKDPHKRFGWLMDSLVVIARNRADEGLCDRFTLAASHVNDEKHQSMLLAGLNLWRDRSLGR